MTPRRLRAAALGLAALTCAPACQRTYLYRPADLPPIRNGHLIVTEPDGDRLALPISRLAVARAGRPFAVPPSADDLLALRDGLPTSIHTVQLDVDASGEVWTDYALVGAGLGASLGALLGLTLDARGDRLGPFTLLIGLTGALDGLLLGSLVGAIAVSGTEDHRFGAP